jgi:hypothetical protein
MNSILFEVLTIAEVAREYHVHPTAIRKAIGTGRYPLEGRKSPDTTRGVWLITRASCERRWGRQNMLNDVSRHKPNSQLRCQKRIEAQQTAR